MTTPLGYAPSSASSEFFDYLERRRIKFQYEIDDFLYGHQGPCPQPARDHPFGQIPEVLNVPPEEWADWKKFVSSYYLKNAEDFGLQSAGFAIEHFADSGLIGYADIDDEKFSETLSEGLYSKFLCPTLDPVDEKRFADFLTDPEHYTYLKSDFSCMRVIEKTWPDEFVGPAVVLLRRPKNEPYAYEAVAIALSYWDEAKQAFVDVERPFTPTDGRGWRLAKYFVLQGAIHRINLIDHTEVHFPTDPINAISKTLLPTRNLLMQLLLPHLYLSLPVNNTVLEGERSLINRKTWYPWSPFVARGDEVRKLFPFGWYGSTYYDETPNSAYPPFRFEPLPAVPPSRYGVYFEAYRKPIRKFVRRVLNELPADDGIHTDWIEIQSWALQISSWLPGFPVWSEFLAETPQQREHALEVLTDTVTTIIHNAAVVHSADHTTLHKMMNDTPVPFILRVPPPRGNGEKPTPSPKVKALIKTIEEDLANWVRKEAGNLAEAIFEKIEHPLANYVAERLEALCWPTDLVYARMADLLFYRPHNVTLLIDCDYAFKDGSVTLSQAITDFQKELREVAASQSEVVRQYGFPMLEPPDDASPEEKERIREQDCIAAGVQY